MIYWFAEAPEQSVTFAYDFAAHARVESRLNGPDCGTAGAAE